MVGSWFFSRPVVPGVRMRLGSEAPSVFILDQTNPAAMHLGDVLFFMDMIWAARQAGQAVYLVGAPDLREVLAVFDVQYAPTLSDIPPGIVCTKSDSSLFITERRHTVLGFNFWRLDGHQRISALIFSSLNEWLVHYFPGLTLPIVSESPVDFFRSQVCNRLTPSADLASHYMNHSSITLVNSFVASQRLSTARRQRAFAKHVNQVAQQLPHSTMVCVGSSTDAKQRIMYAVHHDWRGQLSIGDLTIIMMSGLVKRVITFDTFTAHLAILCGCPVDVFIKSNRHWQFTQDRFVPSHQSPSPVSWY